MQVFAESEEIKARVVHPGSESGYARPARHASFTRPLRVGNLADSSSRSDGRLIQGTWPSGLTIAILLIEVASSRSHQKYQVTTSDRADAQCCFSISIGEDRNGAFRCRTRNRVRFQQRPTVQGAEGAVPLGPSFRARRQCPLIFPDIPVAAPQKAL